MELLEIITIIILSIFGLSLISITVLTVLILNQVFKISKKLSKTSENIEAFSNSLANPITTLMGVIGGIAEGKNILEKVKKFLKKEQGEKIYEE